jgi:hypothetical protein
MAKDKISGPPKLNLRPARQTGKPPENASAASSVPSSNSNDEPIGTFDDLMDLDPKTVKRVTVLPDKDMGHKIITRKIQ